jgi:hypothetical protein
MHYQTPFSRADGFDGSVLHFFEEHQLPLLRILADRKAERIFWKGDKTQFSTHLAINNVYHIYLREKSPLTAAASANSAVDPKNWTMC